MNDAKNEVFKGWKNVVHKFNGISNFKRFALFGAIFFLIFLFALTYRISLFENTDAFFTRSIDADRVTIETASE